MCAICSEIIQKFITPSTDFNSDSYKLKNDLNSFIKWLNRWQLDGLKWKVLSILINL